MEKNVKLTINDIYNHRFEKDVKGYNPDEVDSFLDQIIQDYDAYEKAIASLEEEIANLNKDLSSKTNDVSSLAKRAMDAEAKAKELEIANASLNKNESPFTKYLLILQKSRCYRINYDFLFLSKFPKGVTFFMTI